MISPHHSGELAGKPQAISDSDFPKEMQPYSLRHHSGEPAGSTFPLMGECPVPSAYARLAMPLNMIRPLASVFTPMAAHSIISRMCHTAQISCEKSQEISYLWSLLRPALTTSIYSSNLMFPVPRSVRIPGISCWPIKTYYDLEQKTRFFEFTTGKSYSASTHMVYDLSARICTRVWTDADSVSLQTFVVRTPVLCRHIRWQKLPTLQ